MSPRNDIDPRLIAASTGRPNLVTAVVDNAPILETTFARWRMPCMSAGLEVGFFEALRETPITVTELANRVGVDARITRAMLAVLAASGILTAKDNRFGLTDVARTYLLKHSPFFCGEVLTEEARTSFEHGELLKLLHPVTERRGWFESKSEIENWESGKMPRKMAKEIAAYMQAECAGNAAAAAASGVYSGVNRVLDVGGGSGAMSVAIATHQPETRCTLIDLRAMCREAKTYVQEAGVEDRIDMKAVNMFRQPWPKGHDGVVFSNIFHDWAFDTCATLASRAYEALEDGGHIFVHEMLLDDDHGGPAPTAGFSVQMAFGTRGQQFSFSELKDLLEDAGFTDIGVTHTTSYYSIVTGTKRRVSAANGC